MNFITAAVWNANIRQNLTVLHGHECIITLRVLQPKMSLKQVLGGLALTLMISPKKFGWRAFFGLSFKS